MKRKKKRDELVSGYTFESSLGAVCHFDHMPKKDAETLAAGKEWPHIVETVNWTLADKKTVHRNRYFAFGLTAALGLAGQLEMMSATVAEEVICVRPASEEEAEEARAAFEFFEKQMPQAVAVLPVLPAAPQAGGRTWPDVVGVAGDSPM